jgi:hypothetical protein
MEPMRSAPLCSESLPHLLPVMQQAPPLPPLSRCSANQVLVAASRLHLRRRFHQSGPCCRTAGPRLRPSSSRYWSSLSDIMTLRLSNLKAFKMVRCSGKVFHEIGNWSKPSAARVPPAKPLRRPLQCGVPSRPRPRLGLGSTSRNTRRHSGGKCFRCLAKDHKIVHCLNCLGNGHFARHCKAPPSSARHRATALPPASSSKPNINSRLAFPSIHSRLTYPPGSVHNRLTFPARSYAAAVSSSAMADEHHQYVPNQRPSQGRAVVVAKGRCRRSSSSYAARQWSSPPTMLLRRRAQQMWPTSYTGCCASHTGTSPSLHTSPKTSSPALIIQSSRRVRCALARCSSAPPPLLFTHGGWTPPPGLLGGTFM